MEKYIAVEGIGLKAIKEAHQQYNHLILQQIENNTPTGDYVPHFLDELDIFKLNNFANFHFIPHEIWRDEIRRSIKQLHEIPDKVMKKSFTFNDIYGAHRHTNIEKGRSHVSHWAELDKVDVLKMGSCSG